MGASLMRIICPNCDAQYEVEDGAIPVGGRDVQCSNCGNAWFQEHEPTSEDLTQTLYAEPAQPVAPITAALDQGDDDEPAREPAPELPKRTLDDTVLAVLREEAEREMSARKSEGQAIEIQGDLGLPPPVSAAVGAAAAASRYHSDAPELTDAERRIATMKGEKVPVPKSVARRDLLPDIEEINSTLKPSERASEPVTAPVNTEVVDRSSGFRSGFSLMLLVAVMLVALYVMAPQIKQQIPGLSATMDSYVAVVDQLRGMVAGLMRKATAFIQGFTA